MTDNSETIAENALKPKRVVVDGRTAEQHSVADQLAANKAGLQSAQPTARQLGIRKLRTSSPGARDH